MQRYQQADADYQKALAADARARAALEAAQRQLDVIDTQKQQTAAALAGAIADRDTAQLNLGYTELRAPIDGAVGNRSARDRRLRHRRRAADLAGARARAVGRRQLQGEPARAHARRPAGDDRRPTCCPAGLFHGHVASLAPATGAVFSVLPPENATGNFTKIVQRVPVRVLLDGDAATLGRCGPGLSVTADVDER